ncbi:MAG TPA: beta-galactosidase [Actinomycetota bacterium]|nr:beta-galactosidase [Actinomycetota bacterium]
MTRARVEVTPSGLVIDGRERMLVSGEVHSWRLDPSRWGAVLDTVRSLGFGFISTYVPWSVHERGPGDFDFTGPRDIVRFIGMAADRDLKVMVRPGPNAASELPDSGWPRRVLDDPRCRALRCDGRPYLLATATHHAFMPSYASRLVMDAVAGWYDEIIPKLAALQHPDGPVIACQVDNELGFHFQPHPYAMDYHPDAIAQYRAWLTARYGRVEALNDAYGFRARDFADVQPPRDGTDDPELWRLDWVEWKEQHLRDTLAALASMQRDRGMDRVPLVHNDYPASTTPHDTGALERSGAVDIAAGDIYTTRQGGRFMASYARLLTGSTRLPFLCELGAGWLTLPWLLPMGVEAADEETGALRALSGGIRALNVYMLVERDRWYGSPMKRDGTARDKSSLYSRLHDMLERLDWKSLRRDARVLLVTNRTEGRRIAARQVLGDAVPCFSQLLPMDMRLFHSDDAAADVLREWESGFESALQGAGVDHDRALSTSLPPLDRYDVVLMPTLDSLDERVWATLRAAAAAGTTVAVGPRLPSLDSRLHPLAFDAGGIQILGDPDEARRLLPRPAFRTDSDALDLVRLTGGGREVLMAFNSSDDELEEKVTFDGSARFEGRWSSGTEFGGGSFTVRLGPWGAQVWEAFR